MKRGIRMIAGIPGSGISGLFYLVIALWMPIRELHFTIYRKYNLEKWLIVRRQTLLTISLIIGMGVTGWFIGWLLILISGTNLTTNSNPVINILRLSPFVFALATLVSVYLSVHMLRFIVRRK